VPPSQTAKERGRYESNRERGFFIVDGSARVFINSAFNLKQRAFLDFMLSHYITVGVEELDQQKLTPLLRLKYGAIQDAVADLGLPEEIGKTFAGLQKYLYLIEIPRAGVKAPRVYAAQTQGVGQQVGTSPAEDGASDCQLLAELLELWPSLTAKDKGEILARARQ